MAEFKLTLESVQDGLSTINLFDKVEAKDTIKKTDETEGFEVIDQPFTEYLMHLTAEQQAEEHETKKKAEIIVVVDKSGSMQGKPWKQVQSALIKMLDITRGVNNCHAISYNQNAEKMPLSGNRKADKSLIESTRSGGSTNFVAVFKELGKMFKAETESFSLLNLKPKEKKKDNSVPHYIFLMTDGQDTCNSPKDIIIAQEHLQAEIEMFGGEVIFNVLGFSDDHNEEFLANLALIGTSDGSYSFVSPTEGDNALEERLVALVESTSNSIGRLVNIEVNTENVEILGDWLGESEKEAILPALLSKKNDKITISTKKFVRIKKGEEAKMTLRLHEKLRGDTKPMDATIKSFEKLELTDKNEVDVHNLKKLRSALNLVSSRLADSSENDAAAKAVYDMVKNKISGMKDLDSENNDVKRLQGNILGYVRQYNYVFNQGIVSDRERAMRSKGMRSVQATPCMGMEQNVSSVPMRSSRSTTKYSKSSRSKLQCMVRQTDYSRYSDEED